MPGHMPPQDPQAVAHSPLEDAQGLGMGVLLCGLGITLLSYLGFMTGQTAGIALILSYVTGISFGWVFFAINIPFYWLAQKRLGWEFTLKSLGCVTGLSVATELMPRGLRLEALDPLLGVVLFGAVTGLGLLAIFRHKGSLGGIGVVALMVQDRTGFRAGYVQLAVDACIFAVAFALFPPRVVIFSLIGAVVLNGVIAFNHRRDRYIAP
ncbi:YitT family protein [Meridianimarinicoccus roseus]|nr:YitT family protein [Meridianimarinicoccus roseus]